MTVNKRTAGSDTAETDQWASNVNNESIKRKKTVYFEAFVQVDMSVRLDLLRPRLTASAHSESFPSSSDCPESECNMSCSKRSLFSV